MEININSCTKEYENCPVFKQIDERYEFENAISDLDKTAITRRAILGDFIVACLNGSCPGKDPRLAQEIIRKNKNND